MSVPEIEALLKSKKDYKIAARLVAVLSVAKGESSRKAEQLLLLSHNQICIWVKRFNEMGLKGLEDKEKPGRKPAMSAEQMQWLRRLVLEESPARYGFNTETWTAPLIVKQIKDSCNIDYSDDAVYVILKKKLKLAHIKGRGFYPEADKEKREIFVEALKKTL